MTTRTAILKGYRVHITYMDGSRSNEFYEPDEIGTLDDMWTGLMVNELHGVSHLSVAKVWSEPGETVLLKVKNGWD